MTTLLILSGFYIIWLAALLTVAYTPRLLHNYTLFKAINSILFVVISVLVWRHSGMNMFTYWPLLAAFCLAAFGDIAIGVANNRYGPSGASHSVSGMAGVGFFSIAHVFYLLFFTVLPHAVVSLYSAPHRHAGHAAHHTAPLFSLQSAYPTRGHLLLYGGHTHVLSRAECPPYLRHMVAPAPYSLPSQW